LIKHAERRPMNHTDATLLKKKLSSCPNKSKASATHSF